jgi:hypothetical protein
VARYELMDLTTGNFAGIYESEAAALRDVAAHVARFGEDAADGLALGYNDFPDGAGRLIAEGADLVALARRVDTAPDATKGAAPRRRRARTAPTTVAG